MVSEDLGGKIDDRSDGKSPGCQPQLEVDKFDVACDVCMFFCFFKPADKARLGQCKGSSTK